MQQAVRTSVGCTEQDQLESVDKARDQIAGIFNNNSKDILGMMKRRTEKDWLSLDTRRVIEGQSKGNRRASEGQSKGKLCEQQTL